MSKIMIIPTFTFNADANGWLSEPIDIEGPVIARIELPIVAPVVTLKQEEDGGWANYGQSPKDARCYEIEINPKERMSIMLATPVNVLKCYLI